GRLEWSPQSADLVSLLPFVGLLGLQVAPELIEFVLLALELLVCALLHVSDSSFDLLLELEEEVLDELGRRGQNTREGSELVIEGLDESVQLGLPSRSNAWIPLRRGRIGGELLDEGLDGRLACGLQLQDHGLHDEPELDHLDIRLVFHGALSFRSAALLCLSLLHGLAG